MNATFSALLPEASNVDQDTILSILADLPIGVTETLAKARCRIRPLKEGETYAAASPALRRLSICVDRWPAPPAGLFVIEERTVYIRSRSRMTICHESMHALDVALGNGIYFSSHNSEIQHAFREARSFVTPYAETGSDEYFAECARAYCDRFNDDASLWPKATHERLHAVDAAMYAILDKIFTGIAGKHELQLAS
ncbi:MAG: hypothetical protein ACYDHD_00035 [Vulcanimicrobiaceae bacterium]